MIPKCVASTSSVQTGFEKTKRLIRINLIIRAPQGVFLLE